MNKLLAIAKNEVGEFEDPPYSNRTKYGEWFGLNGVEWCGIFVSWCFDQAGIPLRGIGYTKGFAGCMTAMEHFSKKGMITTNPQPGDIVFYSWKNNKHYTHTGIVINLRKDYIEAVEGNTSLVDSDNGGKVMLRSRNRKFCTFVRVKVNTNFKI